METFIVDFKIAGIQIHKEQRVCDLTLQGKFVISARIDDDLFRFLQHVALEAIEIQVA